MKRNFSKVLCLVLICSFVFSSLPQLFAGYYSQNDLINAIYSDLNSACNIVASGRAYTEIQNARPYLKHAQRLLKKQGVSHCFDHRLDRVIDNAKMEILWNNRHEALQRINLAMRLVENCNANACSQNNHYRTPHHRGHSAGRTAAGAVIAAPVAVGLGALLVNIFRNFNWGQVSGTSTRVRMPNIPSSIVPIR